MRTVHKIYSNDVLSGTSFMAVKYGFDTHIALRRIELKGTKMHFEEEFSGIDFTRDPPAGGEYERCAFRDCRLNAADLSNAVLTECEFDNCDLSMAKTANTVIQDTLFKSCKMLGFGAEQCNDLGLSFTMEDCDLSHASFHGIRLTSGTFTRIKFHETDFTECDLQGSVFDECDFSGAIFGRTNLEKADFRTSFNYSIDPEMNKIKRARFSLLGLGGLLDKYDIAVE